MLDKYVCMGLGLMVICYTLDKATIIEKSRAKSVWYWVLGGVNELIMKPPTERCDAVTRGHQSPAQLPIRPSI